MFSNRDSKFRFLFESLEERVLFDAAPDASMSVCPEEVAEPVPAQTQQAEASQAQQSLQLIVIDSGVEDSEQLLAELLESTGSEGFEILELDPNSDGVTQISDLLATSHGKFSAIHIISHGDEGQVNLGNTTLSGENLSQYADQIAGWADALTQEADLLFYGCDLAGNLEGQQFIQSISTLTEADVAASDDLTGSAELGGDWDLEQAIGTIETATLEAENWDHTLLGDADGDGLDHDVDLDDDNDGILDVDEGFVAPTTVAINQANFNSPGFPTDTDLSNGTIANLNGLLGGVLDFTAETVNNGGGNPAFNTVEISNNATLGDFIFVQPNGTGGFPADNATYTFDFNNPVDNLTFLTGGINNSDIAVYEAFSKAFLCQLRRLISPILPMELSTKTEMSSSTLPESVASMSKITPQSLPLPNRSIK